MSFIEDLKTIFKNKGNGLVKIIAINIAIFIIINIIGALIKFSGSNKDSIDIWLALPSDLSKFPTRFWTIITYMFLHLDLMHILFNMLWLFWIGKIFVEFLGSQRLVSTYLLGGVSGGLLFMLISAIVPSFSNTYLLGASAGVMAVVVGTATLVPEYVVQLMFFGPVKLKYLALVSFVLTTLLDFSVNTGGKIAHIGGAIYGLIYITQYKKGNDFSKIVNKWINLISKAFNFFGKKSKLKVSYKRTISDEEYNLNKLAQQKRMDEILDKISKSGYESLSKQEKDILFKISNNKKI